MSFFPTNILLATDGSSEAELAAKMATDLAQKTGSKLHVVHAYYWATGSLLDPISSGNPLVREAVEKQARATLQEAVLNIQEGFGGTVDSSRLRVGRPDAEIVTQAEEIGAGLIVVGSRGLGAFGRSLMGSVSESVVRHAHCPVLVVRGGPVVLPTKVLLATDGSESAAYATQAAVELSRKTDSELHVLYVGEDAFSAASVYPEATNLEGVEQKDPALIEELGRQFEQVARQTLDAEVEEVQAVGGTVTEAHLRMGTPAAEVVDLAEGLGVGLVVVGNRGLGGVRRALMGSVSDTVVRHAHCPVMVVRKEEHQEHSPEQQPPHATPREHVREMGNHLREMEKNLRRMGERVRRLDEQLSHLEAEDDKAVDRGRGWTSGG
jgi:nucleotide-binding universal stress UspA family protein